MIKLSYEKDNFGIVGNKFISNSNIPDIAVSVYVVMRTIFFNMGRGCSYITLNDLYLILAVNPSQVSQTKPINEAILYLVEKKYLRLFDIWNKEILPDNKIKRIIKVSFDFEDENNIFIKGGGFTKIPECNILNLLKYINENKGMKKYQLIRFYLLIARSCSNENQLSSISQSFFHKKLAISSKTCAEWNLLLQQIGVIYYNSDYSKTKGDGVSNITTYYFHRNNYENKQEDEKGLFERTLDSLAKEKGWSKLDKKEQSNKRSESMKKVWAERKEKLSNANK